jgi:pre-rRNA-processing protein TSR4
MAAPSECVELGFVEKCIDCVKLRSQYFPSKVGGRPAWLDLLNLPKPNELVCLNCGKPCVFLLQVYSPNNSREDCFHRTVLIFVCRETSCVSAKNNFRVFRCQLPRENEFYSSQSPDENGSTIDIAVNKAQLCVICGSSGPLSCANCKVAAYCSKAHQQLHWKAGHKLECKTGMLVCLLFSTSYVLIFVKW